MGRIGLSALVNRHSAGVNVPSFSDVRQIFIIWDFIPSTADVDGQKYFVLVCEPSRCKSVFRGLLLIGVLELLTEFIERIGLFVCDI